MWPKGVRPPLMKGMRVRLTADGREHIGSSPRLGGRSWTGTVWRKPRGAKAVCVLLDGHSSHSARMYYAGFWEQDAPAKKCQGCGKTPCDPKEHQLEDGCEDGQHEPDCPNHHVNVARSQR